MTSHLAKFIDALTRKGCRPRHEHGEQRRAHCPGPGHRRGDIRPSLGVWGHPDKVIFNCFVCGKARAAKDAILEALDLAWADLYAPSSAPTPATKPCRRHLVATYRYEDIDGCLLSEKRRYPPKDFRWRSPRPGGGFDWTKAEGVTLYRLPHLIDARLVVVVEGEKAVHRLVGLRFAATCPPTGSGKWVQDYTDALWRVGAVVVVVIGDYDRSGRQHAGRVVRACHGYQPTSCTPLVTDEPWGSWPCATLDDPEVQPLRAKLLTLDDLPYRGDICDWFDAGHTAAELHKLIQTAPDLDELKHAKQEHRRRVDRDRQRKHLAKKYAQLDQKSSA